MRQPSENEDEALRRDASDSTKRALRLEPNDPRILPTIAAAFGIIGSWAEGQRCAERAIEINPDLDASHVAMVMVCAYSNDMRKR